MMSSGPTGDAVMVYMFDDRRRTLLVRARGRMADYWMPPGGHIDDGETTVEAACRELFEELHLRCQPDDLYELGRCEKDFGTGTLTLLGHRPVLCETVEPGAEIAEARWVELDSCMALPMMPATRYGFQLIAKRRDSGN
jgi:8-oxo-dGTP diphosphatase